jgi:hypothetical protein
MVSERIITNRETSDEDADQVLLKAKQNPSAAGKRSFSHRSVLSC